MDQETEYRLNSYLKARLREYNFWTVISCLIAFFIVGGLVAGAIDSFKVERERQKIASPAYRNEEAFRMEAAAYFEERELSSFGEVYIDKDGNNIKWDDDALIRAGEWVYDNSYVKVGIEWYNYDLIADIDGLAEEKGYVKIKNPNPSIDEEREEARKKYSDRLDKMHSLPVYQEIFIKTALVYLEEREELSYGEIYVDSYGKNISSNEELLIRIGRCVYLYEECFSSTVSGLVRELANEKGYERIPNGPSYTSW